MKLTNLELMSVDELWALHQELDVALARRISAEKNQLDQWLRLLKFGAPDRRERRPYPPVFPKYKNPDKPSETWAGRGKQPRWLTAQLRSGKKLEDFKIPPASYRKAVRPRSRTKSKPPLMVA
jgi:DNA-binding protein H-NS